jgi:hypothetical protein
MTARTLKAAKALCVSTASLGVGYGILAFGGPVVAREFAQQYTARDAIAHVKPPVARIEPKEALHALETLAITDADSIARASEVITAGMVHYWPSPGAHDRDLECRLLEQPDLWIRLRVLEWTGSDPDELAMLRRRERADWRTALTVGVGYCSQQALALTGFLRERGVEARTVGLDGHVVTVAVTPVGEWVLDPDYGVVIRHPLAEVARSPDIVRSVYADAGYSTDKVERLVEIYAAGKNGEYGGTRIGAPSRRADQTRHVALWGGLIAAVGAGLLWRRTSVSEQIPRGAPSGEDPA